MITGEHMGHPWIKTAFGGGLLKKNAVILTTKNGAYEIRTRDLLHAMEARSQLRQCPNESIIAENNKICI